MKKILVVLMILFCATAHAQLYQPMPQPGYYFNRGWFEGLLTIPTNNTQLSNITGGRDVGRIRYNVDDSSVQIYTGYQWLAGNRGASSASNGLTLTSGNITWGGRLTGNTTIAAANKEVIFDSVFKFEVYKNGGNVIRVVNTGTSISAANGNSRLNFSGSLVDLTSASDIDIISVDSIRLITGDNNRDKSQIYVYSGLISINPYLGVLKYDTLNNETSQNTLQGWTSTSGSDRGKAGYVTISSPLSLTGGALSLGTVGVANGGTGATSLTANSLLIGNGSSAISATTTGTGVLTALGVNVGSAGAFVVNGGALGTPSSGTLTNATGLPEGGLSTTDITTNNTSTSKHGFFPKLTANSIYYVSNGGSLTALTVGAANTVLAGNGVTSAPTWTATSSLTGLPYIAKTGTSTLTGDVLVDIDRTGVGPFNFNVQDGSSRLLAIDKGADFYGLGDIDNQTGNTFVKINDATQTLFLHSSAINGASVGDALTVVDASTGELGVAPNLAFNLQKQGTEIYASNGLIFAKDKAGNKTQISPHNKNGDWVYNSTNAKGSTTEINMTDAIKTIEQLTKRVYELEKKLNVKTTKPKKLIHKK